MTRAALPLIVWAAQFTACYIVVALGCRATQPRPGEVSALVALITGAGLVVTLSLLVSSYRRLDRLWLTEAYDEPQDRSAFMAFTSMLFATLSLLGMTWVAWGVQLVGGCG
ncbi:MAG: hypothetical protein IT178_07600 [Acidobacteria bacterium]|nr:hypothetical protein [Acidobacteriota bacterium]